MHAQVKRAFAVSEDAPPGGSSNRRAGDVPKAVEWLEGNVYFVGDVDHDPYQSVLVAWVGLEVGTKDWSYRFLQTENACSPWDLELSTFALPRSIAPRSFPLCEGQVSEVSPRSILRLLDRFLTACHCVPVHFLE